MNIKNKYVVVIGCSNFGATIATNLSKLGNNLVVIDIDNTSFNNLTDEYGGFTINGDGTDLEILLDAKIEEADLLIISTNNDNKNFMIAKIAKEIFNVKKIISILHNLNKEIIYKNLNIGIIKPADLLIREFKKILEEERVDL